RTTDGSAHRLEDLSCRRLEPRTYAGYRRTKSPAKSALREYVACPATARSLVQHRNASPRQRRVGYTSAKRAFKAKCRRTTRERPKSAETSDRARHVARQCCH